MLPVGRVHQQLTVPGEPSRTEYAGVLGGAVTEHSPPALQRAGRQALGQRLRAGRARLAGGPKPEGGWRVIDLWDSEDAANALYGSEQFKPVMAAVPDAGITTWPMYRVEIDHAISQMT